MTTWKDYGGAGGSATTQWGYDGYRGFLTNKTYADSSVIGYAYTGAGRFSSRIWARGVSTTIAYDDAGQVETVLYSNGTPGVTNAHDRLGRLVQVNWGTNSLSRSYSDENLLLAESRDGLTVTNGFDWLLRRTNVQLRISGSAEFDQGYGYDGASRLDTAVLGGNGVSYSYLTNADLIGTMTFKRDETTRMTTTRSYDFLNRLTEIGSEAGAVEVASFEYAYSTASQRSSVTNVDGSRWEYSYDDLGQVIAGKKYWSDNTPVAGQQFEYDYDDIGNRQSAGAGGDESGSNLRIDTYTANSLNQYTQRTVASGLDVIGEAATNAVALVNGAEAYRMEQHYRKELSVDNSSESLWLSITNAGYVVGGGGDIVTNVVGNASVPKTPEAFSYDMDGNLTTNGRWALTWDAENRLVSMERLSSTPTNSWRKLAFEYDPFGIHGAP